MDIEEWRPILNFEGWYEVSNLGRVRRVRPGMSTRPFALLRPWATDDGYPKVALRRDGKTHSNQRVHRLVALTFLGPPPPGTIAHHIDGNRANNNATNLQWATRQQNAGLTAPKRRGRRRAREPWQLANTQP